MATDFVIGCTCNFLQPHEEVPPSRRFEMVRDTGAFDYINGLPPNQILRGVRPGVRKNRYPHDDLRRSR
jgi:hypothetical protein